eukprot:scaffold6860_cov162-Amphora_coffeaeformis.AAC.3
MIDNNNANKPIFAATTINKNNEEQNFAGLNSDAGVTLVENYGMTAILSWPEPRRHSRRRRPSDYDQCTKSKIQEFMLQFRSLFQEAQSDLCSDGGFQAASLTWGTIL